MKISELFAKYAELYKKQQEQGLTGDETGELYELEARIDYFTEVV